MDTPTYLLTVEPGGICIFDREPTNSQHSHRYWEICIVLNGQGEYLEGGQIFELRPGSLFASPPHVVHEIRSPVTRDLELFFVSFTVLASPGGVGDEEESIIGAFLDRHHVAIADVTALQPYVDLILGATTSAVANRLVRLFTLDAMDRLRIGPKLSGNQVVTSEVQRALSYIHARSDRSLTVSDVADHVSLSPKSIHRRFMNQVGHSVAKEIRRQKMRTAAHLLLMGYSVHEVAQRVGIEDDSQFSAAFLSELGSRPKRFQQTYLPGNMK